MNIFNVKQVLGKLSTFLEAEGSRREDVLNFLVDAMDDAPPYVMAKKQHDVLYVSVQPNGRSSLSSLQVGVFDYDDETQCLRVQIDGFDEVAAECDLTLDHWQHELLDFLQIKINEMEKQANVRIEAFQTARRNYGLVA